VPKHLDSPSPAIRAIERWKRGLTALAIVGIFLLASALVAGLIAAAASYLGFDEVIFGTIAFLMISPWMLGNRETLSTIGQMAKVSDDR